MKESLRIVPFPVFQCHCGERNFKYAGRPGAFNVSCKLPGGPQKCNPEVCPIWNSDRVERLPPPDMSLREINLKLRNDKVKPKIAPQNRTLNKPEVVLPPIDMCGGPI